MTVESATYINGLNNTLPGSSDVISEGDDHIRLIKSVLKNTFPNLSAAMNASAAELNQLVGATITAYAKTLLDDADAATARTTLGAMAHVSPGTSGNLLQSNGSAWTSAAPRYLVNAVDTKTAGYTVVAGDCGKVHACNGTFTVAFTAAATLGNGFALGICNTGSGTITLDPNSTETIDGQLTVTLPAGTSCVVVCTGSAWYTIGRQQGGVVNVQTFSSSGTWYKPAVGTIAMIECWGGGGGGCRYAGGAGGNCSLRFIPLADLPSTVNVTIGQGGAGTYTSTGNPGGHTTFGSFLIAHGGGNPVNTSGGAGGFGDNYSNTYGGGHGGGVVVSEGPEYYGLSGGTSFYGGGGGGGGGNYGQGLGGVSIYGGNGGNGGNGNGGAGLSPGGGGGGSYSGTGGSGANGYCRVTVF